MARVNIDGKAWKDPRIKRLAKRRGWSLRETIGTLAAVWDVAYDNKSPLMPVLDVDTAAESDGFAADMVADQLAEFIADDMVVVVPSDLVRLRGVTERIQYLLAQAERGRVGGLAKAKRTLCGGQANGKQPPGLPPDQDPDPAPAPSPSQDHDPDPDRDQSNKRAPKSAPGFREVVSHFDRRFEEAFGTKPTWGKKQGDQVNRLLKSHPAEVINKHADVMFDGKGPTWITTRDLGTLVGHFDKFVPNGNQVGGSGLQAVLEIARGGSKRVGRVEPSDPADYPEGDLTL